MSSLRFRHETSAKVEGFLQKKLYRLDCIDIPGPSEVHDSLHDSSDDDVHCEGHDDEHVHLPERSEDNGNGSVHHSEGADHLIQGRYSKPRVLTPDHALQEQHLDIRSPRVAAPAE